MHTEMGAPTSADILGKDRDWKLGFLMIGNKIFSLVNNYNRTMPALSMFGIDLFFEIWYIHFMRRENMNHLDYIKNNKIDLSVYYRDSVIKSIRSAIPVADKIIFDDDACEKIGNLLREKPEDVVDRLNLVVPFDKPTYLEVNIDALYEAAGFFTSRTPLRDWKVGYMFIDNLVYSLVSSYVDDLPLIGGMATLIDGYPEMDKNKKFSPYIVNSPMIHNQTLDRLSNAQKLSLAQKFWLIHTTHKGSVALEGFWAAYVGYPLVISALVLAMQNTANTAVTNVPARRVFINGKMTPIMAHKSLSLNTASVLT